MGKDDDELFAGMISEAISPNAREIPARCPCGSGHHGYNLYNHKGELLLYCCFSCEKERRKQLKDDGESLTKVR